MAGRAKKATDDGTPPAEPRHTLSRIDTQVIYCGDNIDQLRRLPDACVDLIYIDPPFNSNRNYEVFWGETREKRAFEDRHASTRAYIHFMRPRCRELHRVLKRTGSFYYHCDWHASHYVKVMLDQILGENNFRSEIIWKRTSAHNDSKKFSNIHDTILYYVKSNKYTWNPLYLPHDEKYVKSHYNRVDADGRRYRLHEIVRSASMGPRPNLVYEYKGFTPQWGWRVEREKLEALDSAGLITRSKSNIPYRILYLDERDGPSMPSIWDDIPPVNSQALERIGYPTQKPLPLLERIVKSSSDPDDIVLDAFCGCGTALVAAQRLDRRWIGIDISPTACHVMAGRLQDDCGLREGKDFVVRDLPHTEDQLRRMPPFEFENWAVIALGGIPNAVKVGDWGIDGRIYPISAVPERRGKGKGEFDFMDVWYPIQVKQKDKVDRKDIDPFEAVMMREDRPRGYFVSFDFTSGAVDEMRAFRQRTGKRIIPITVREILEKEEEVADKLA